MEQTIFNQLRRLNRWIALAVGTLLFACAGIVLLDIILRRLGGSLGGTDEISGYVMAIATSWGMAFTLLELGHVRIDLLRSRANATFRSLFDLFSMTVLTGVIVMIAIKSWPVLERSLVNGSRANTPLETPLAWVQAPWFAGWVWFALVSCIMTLAALSLVIKGQHDAVEKSVGAFAEQDMLQ